MGEWFGDFGFVVSGMGWGGRFRGGKGEVYEKQFYKPCGYSPSLFINVSISINHLPLQKNTIALPLPKNTRFCTYKEGNPSKDFYALKILKKQAIIRLKQVDHISSEKEILISIRHPFIVNLYGCFHDSRYLYLVLEYVVGGEFFTHLRKAGRFENEQARFYAGKGCVLG